VSQVREADVVVIGLGGIGSAAAYWLARRGASVIGLEQFEFGHVRGESHDHGRIFRLSYHDPRYVQLAKTALTSWREVEAESGEQLILTTGGLDFAPPGTAIPLSPYHAALDACGVGYEKLDAAEAMRRYPQFKLDESVEVMFQPDAGVAAADRANAAHQRLAREHGAHLYEKTGGVEAIDDSGDEIVIQSGGMTIRAGQVVISAGPWTNAVAGLLGSSFNLTVTREQVLYFAPPNLDAYRPDRMPVWIWLDDPAFYGLPVFGEQAIKVAQDAGGYETTGDGRSFDPDEANRKRVRDFTAGALPGVVDSEVLLKTCLYTLTPDREFILDRLPGHDKVLLFSGGGHAFKFATELGRTLSDLALEGTTRNDLSLFSPERPILHDPNAPRNWMT
jgi:sarcosine oxidase